MVSGPPVSNTINHNNNLKNPFNTENHLQSRDFRQRTGKFSRVVHIAVSRRGTQHGVEGVSGAEAWGDNQLRRHCGGY